MLEITTHKFLFLKRKEFWFYDSEKINKPIYSVFCYSVEKDAKTRSNVLAEQTSLLDLEKSSEELFNNINRTFKYHIHKAENLGINTEINYSPTKEECVQIINEFNSFAKERSIEWSPKRIFVLQRSGNLVVSKAFLNGQKICTHIYLHDTHRVVLMHSYHQKFSDNNTRGYANKLLHWKDILSFKAYGLKLYDFGGINMGQHVGISTFKLSFGGTITDCYSYIEVNTFLAMIINFYKKIRK